MSDKKWEEKYDEFVSNLEIKDKIMFVGYDRTKQFISQLLQETEDRVRREIITKIEMIELSDKPDDYKQALDDLIQSLKGGENERYKEKD